MMKKAFRYWAQLAIALGLVVFNGFVVVKFVGLSYSQFDWKAFAAAYPDPYTPGADSDGDGIEDADDPRPGTFDPTGCFYDRRDGSIVSGGAVDVSGPPTITVGENGSNGCYQFTGDSPGTFTLDVTPPPRCVLASDCSDQAPPPISPANPASTCCTPHGGQGCDDQGCTLAVCSIDAFCCNIGWDNQCAGEARDLCTPLCDPTISQPGSEEDPNNPGFLAGGGTCTDWYSQITLDYPGEGVLGNNIPLYCVPEGVPAPVLSGWGWGVAGLLLMMIGLFGVRRQRLLDR